MHGTHVNSFLIYYTLIVSSISTILSSLKLNEVNVLVHVNVVIYFLRVEK